VKHQGFLQRSNNTYKLNRIISLMSFFFNMRNLISMDKSRAEQNSKHKKRKKKEHIEKKEVWQVPAGH
jgi:hypothetical protein